MTTPLSALASIRDRLASAPEGPQRFLWGATASVCLGDVLNRTSRGGRVADATGRSVLVATRDQFAAALALIQLDGIARRLIVCTPDLPAEHRPAIIAKADVDVVLAAHELGIQNSEIGIRTSAGEFHIPNSEFLIRTEWVLLT